MALRPVAAQNSSKAREDNCRLLLWPVSSSPAKTGACGSVISCAPPLPVRSPMMRVYPMWFSFSQSFSQSALRTRNEDLSQPSPPGETDGVSPFLRLFLVRLCMLIFLPFQRQQQIAVAWNGHHLQPQRDKQLAP